MLTRRLRTLTVGVCALLALAAVGCTGDDDGAGPTPTPTPTASEAIETTIPSVTVSPTAPASALVDLAEDEALFCEADPPPGGEAGFQRRERCGVGRSGFITKLDLIEGEVAVDEFMPSCMQPQGEEGVALVVGRRCVDVNPVSPLSHPAITSQPVFEEFWMQFEDGALVPWCRNAEADASGDPQEACVFASEGGLVPILPAAD